MRIITVTSDPIGSIDWELPHHISAIIERLPEELQQHLLAVLRHEVSAYISLFMEAVLLGPNRSTIAFEMISCSGIELSGDLLSLKARHQ